MGSHAIHYVLASALSLLSSCNDTKKTEPAAQTKSQKKSQSSASNSAPAAKANTTSSLPSGGNGVPQLQQQLQQQGPAPGPAVPVLSSKKGAAAWYFGGIDQALADVHAGWFYTWRANAEGINAPAAMPFVPMIWGSKYVTSTDLAEAKTHGTILLGFNEPDHGDQSSMSVQQALDFWPQLMATGMRLGAPATANDPSRANSWLEQFMSGAKARGYRVDFICLHWYGAGSDAAAMTAELRALVENAHNKFQLPIWVTEYGLINYSSFIQASAEQEAAFATASMAMLNSLPYVERYSWYALPPQGVYSLYNSDGTPSTVGAAYRLGG